MVPKNPVRARLTAAAVLCAAVVSGGLFAASCSGDDDGDLATFCRDYRSLADNNPFAALDMASPADMGAAFEALQDAADTIEGSAPDGLDRLASDYADSIDSMVEILSTADFDPRHMDTSAYRRATIDYEAAATALSNETTARCD